MTIASLLWLQAAGSDSALAFYIVAALLTLGCFYYVFAIPLHVFSGPDKDRLGYLGERKEVVYENLRDLNFEYRAGKLSEDDHQSLKKSLEDEAVGVLAEIAQLEGAATAPISPSKGTKA
jgi:hypothetical protein